MRDLGSGLGRLVNSLGGREHADKAAVIAAWDRSVGPDVAKHTYVKGVRRGELLVDVDSPVWAAQLQAMSEELRSRVNEEVGKELVRKTRFNVSRTVGRERERLAREDDTARGYGGEKVEPAPLDEEEMRQAELLVSNISDADLRAAALRALVAEKEWEKGARFAEEHRRSGGVSEGPEKRP